MVSGGPPWLLNEAQRAGDVDPALAVIGIHTWFAQVVRRMLYRCLNPIRLSLAHFAHQQCSQAGCDGRAEARARARPDPAAGPTWPWVPTDPCRPRADKPDSRCGAHVPHTPGAGNRYRGAAKRGIWRYRV